MDELTLTFGLARSLTDDVLVSRFWRYGCLRDAARHGQHDLHQVILDLYLQPVSSSG